MNQKLRIPRWNSALLLLAWLIFCPALFSASSAQATSGQLETTVSLGFDNESIKAVFAKIEKSTNYKFTYSATDVKNIKPVSIVSEKRKLIDLLKELSNKTQLDFRIINNLISVSPSTKKTVKSIPQPIIKVVDTLVQGIVLDSLKKPLPGVTIFVKSKPTVGTSSDLNGRYSIKVPNNAILVFKMVGYRTVEVPANKPLINVTMIEDNSTLDEVQVVAFGTQKKESVVGAITTINPEKLKVPSSNLTTALSGRIAGVIAYQRSGEPGADNADFFIRGATTFGYKKDPLILIDGLELTATDLARLQPNDIATFSVLKDAASSAVYGARAANGIIMVTTKRGYEGRAKFNLEQNFSNSRATRNLDLADPITFMKLHNEALATRITNGPTSERYSLNKIDGTMAGENPNIFPAVNWQDMLLKNSTWNQRSNLSVMGGGKVASYFVTGTLNQDNGILKVDQRNKFNSNIKLKSYSLRSNVDINVTNSTSMAVRLYGNFDDYNGPIDGGTGVYTKIMNSNPVLFPAFYQPDEANRFNKNILFGNANAIGGIDGALPTAAYLNPYADMVSGYKDSSRSLMLAQIEIKQDLSSVLLNGLKARLMASTQRRSFFDLQRFYRPFYFNAPESLYDKASNTYTLVALNETTGNSTLEYREGQKEISTASYMETAINYDQVFAQKHAVSAFIVGILRNSIAGNAGSLQASLPFRNIGFSSRAAYTFDSRYVAEVSMGYNGSERFSEDKRFGFFPSAGVSWNVNNEKFWEGMRKIIPLLKLRATYGIIGNDAIGDAADRFFYLSEVNLNSAGRGAVFGQLFDYVRPGIAVSRYDNPNITWETSKRLNLGMDITIKEFTINADYATNYTTNILDNRAFIPTTLGLSAATRANTGEAKSKSFETSINYSHGFMNGLFVSATGNFTYATNRYFKKEEPEYLENYRSVVGHPTSQLQGYIAERLFVDQDDIENSPVQTFGEYLPGDIKYRDLNGDGQITPADQTGIGFPTSPEIVYGFGFSASYKGFDLSAFFNGQARSSLFISNSQTDVDLVKNRDTSPFINDSRALIQAYADSHWSEDNRNLYALWPRLSTTNIANNSQISTWFMRNGALLRLKQVEVGYTLPSKFTQRFHIQKLRVYSNGSNLLTFSKFKMWDPELGGAAFNYPVQRVFNFGLQVNF
ncbi:SusC/RagA family TonB-linked outer membrane protein [Pedobacter sp. GSP4]|uniref:SusC/RagA family TonB-linked outer membrane protein n=1 Tax=Pedobacter sp. GSP4 TaxID=3453716 RepID=UPI003EEDA80F